MSNEPLPIGSMLQYRTTDLISSTIIMNDNGEMSHPSSPPDELQLYDPLDFPEPLPFDPVQLNAVMNEHHQGQELLPDDDSCLSEQQDEQLDDAEFRSSSGVPYRDKPYKAYKRNRSAFKSKPSSSADTPSSDIQSSMIMSAGPPFSNKEMRANQSGKKRSRNWIRIGWFAVVLIAVAYIAAIGLLESSDEWDDESSGPGGTGTTLQNTTCTTAACQDDAAALISAMNSSVDPCQNFYEFACGGWIANNPLPAGKSSWGPLKILVQQVSSSSFAILEAQNDPIDPIPLNQARDLYSACMNTDLRETVGLQPLLDLLGSFGGWPMTLTAWDQEQFSWQKTTAAMTRLFKTGVLLAVHNGPDWKSTSNNVIYIGQASFILSREELIDANKPRVASYTDFVTGAARAIRDELKSTATDDQIDIDVAHMMTFEGALANITSSAESDKVYNPMSLSLQDLQAFTDSVTTTRTHATINWFEYLNDIYNLGPGISIPKNEKTIAERPSYIQKLFTLLDETPLRTIANYVQWNLVHQLALKTNEEMRDLNSRFIGTPSNLSTTCANEANKHFDFAISYKYAASFLNEKNETMAMVANLKKAFKSLVTKANWMNRASKTRVKDKLDYMTANIGYPDWVLVKDSIENYYSNLSTSRENYFGSSQNASEFFNTQTFKRLRLPTDRGSWERSPSSVNLFYTTLHNAFTISAGVLQSNPFFKRNRLAALNYGAIGFVIAHEITHGFDGRNRLHDKYGSFTGNSIVKMEDYLERAQCFIQQYGNYASPSGTHLKREQTLNENIADNGAVRQAFRAYKIYVAANGVEPKLPGLEKFNPEQLFFLSLANVNCESRTPESLEELIRSDPHIPYNFRVIGALSNSEDFATHFNCPIGSPMNRKNKCTLW